MATFSVTITKQSDWDESYDIYYKKGGAPLEVGDGYFGGNFPIKPYQTSITATVTTPVDADYGYLVAPVQSRETFIFTVRGNFGWSMDFSVSNYSALLTLIEDDL
jgi:expansin (peptidoglycan-binding protein)